MVTLKPPKAFESYIDRLLEYLVPRMHLNDYRVKWKYVDRIGGTKGLKQILFTDDGYTAEVGVDPVYLTIDIIFSVKAYKKWLKKDESRKAFAEDIVHELAHTYYLPFFEVVEAKFKKDKALLTIARRECESGTERIARSLFESVPQKIWR